jgi:hypothetical protein
MLAALGLIRKRWMRLNRHVVLGLLVLWCVGACKSTPRVRDDDPVSHSPSFTIQRGDRIEVAMTRPNAWPAIQHYRAIVRDDGTIHLPGLGRFDAADKTIRQLERELILSFNGDGELRGSARVTSAPIAHDGIFITPTLETFSAILADPRQVAQLDQDEHARWQWVRMAEDAPLNNEGRFDVMTTHRDADSVEWTIARPAHPELVSDRLRGNVDLAWSARPGVQLKLKPAAAVALENVTRLNGGRRMLLVAHARVIDLPLIEPLPDNQVRITADGYDMSPHQEQRVLAMFIQSVASAASARSLSH